VEKSKWRVQPYTVTHIRTSHEVRQTTAATDAWKAIPRLFT